MIASSVVQSDKLHDWIDKLSHNLSKGSRRTPVDSEPAAAAAAPRRRRTPMGQGGDLGGVVFVPPAGPGSSSHSWDIIQLLKI